MKILFSVIAVALIGTFSFADENHEIIEKVMKEGLKGDDSPLAKTLDGAGGLTQSSCTRGSGGLHATTVSAMAAARVHVSAMV